MIWKFSPDNSTILEYQECDPQRSNSHSLPISTNLSCLYSIFVLEYRVQFEKKTHDYMYQNRVKLNILTQQISSFTGIMREEAKWKSHVKSLCTQMQ